jgi:hypothetical protein
MKFFCAQCRKDHDIEKFEEFRTKTNLRMGKAICPVCGLELFRRLDTDYDLDDENFKAK